MGWTRWEILGFNRGSYAQENISDTPFSLLSSLLFQDIPHHRGKTDETTLDGKSIMGPIYQLGPLHTINKHITALCHAWTLKIVSQHFSPTSKAHRLAWITSGLTCFCAIWCIKAIIALSQFCLWSEQQT